MAAGRSAVLTVKILTDASQAATGVQQATSAYEKFQTGVDRLVPAATITAAAIAAIGTKAVASASRTEQAMGALDSVFGDSAGVVKGWAQTAASSVGLAEAEYSEMASVIGAQLGNMGLSMEDSLAGTQDLINLGADLAATFGGTTAEAVGALSAALRGEADPAERFGLSLKVTDVNARLAEKGLSELEGAALKAAKTQALLELATEQAGGALGQFARESDTVAAQQQIAAAEFENAASALGERLLPFVAAAAGRFAEFARWVSQNSDLVLKLVAVVGGLAGGIIALSIGMKVARGIALAWSAVTATITAVQAGFAAASYGAAGATYAQGVGLVVYKGILLAQAAASKVAAAAQWLWNAALTASPIGLVIAAIVALVAAFIWLWNNVEGFRNFFIGLWGGIVAAATAAWETILGVVQTVWGAIQAVIDVVVSWIVTYIKIVIAIFAIVWFSVLTVVKWVWGAIRTAINAVLTWLAPYIAAVGAVVSAVWNRIVGVVQTVWGAIQAVIDVVLGWLTAYMERVAAIFTAIWNSILAAVQTVWGGIQAAIAVVVGWFQAAWAAVAAFFEPVVRGWQIIFAAVFAVVRSVVQSVVSFFQTAWSGAVAAVSAVVRTLQSIFTTVFNAIMVPINAVSNAFSTVVGWIRQVIDWLNRIKIPDIFGTIGGIFGFSAAAPATAAGVMAGALSPVGAVARAPRVPRLADVLGGGSGGSVVINVYGGLDSSDTIARRIEKVLTDRQRRAGGAGGVVMTRRST